MRKKILLTLTVLALASVTALAANKDGIVTTKDGRMTIATKPTKSVTRTEPNDPSLVKIFDNIGTAYPKGASGAVKVSRSRGPLPFPASPNSGVRPPSHLPLITRLLKSKSQLVTWKEPTDLP